MYNWLKLNRLHLNVKKTNWNLIGTHQRLAQDIFLSINVELLEKVTNILVCFFYKNLNWHFYIDKMC